MNNGMTTNSDRWRWVGISNCRASWKSMEFRASSSAASSGIPVSPGIKRNTLLKWMALLMILHFIQSHRRMLEKDWTRPKRKPRYLERRSKWKPAKWNKITKLINNKEQRRKDKEMKKTARTKAWLLIQTGLSRNRMNWIKRHYHKKKRLAPRFPGLKKWKEYFRKRLQKAQMKNQKQKLKLSKRLQSQPVHQNRKEMLNRIKKNEK